MNEQLIRVLLVDDHSIVREGIRRILEDSQLIEIVGEAADGLDATQKAERLKPDVVLMDLSMPGMSGLDAVGRIHVLSPETHILVLTMHDNTQYAVHVLHAGASGFILKHSAGGDLLKAIRTVHAGKMYVAEEMAEKLMARYSKPRGRAPIIDSLSGREFEVFTLLGGGSTVREAAHRMGLSERTVSTYRARILEKLQLRNNAEIIRLALESGIIK